MFFVKLIKLVAVSFGRICYRKELKNLWECLSHADFCWVMQEVHILAYSKPSYYLLSLNTTLSPLNVYIFFFAFFVHFHLLLAGVYIRKSKCETVVLLIGKSFSNFSLHLLLQYYWRNYWAGDVKVDDRTCYAEGEQLLVRCVLI